MALFITSVPSSDRPAFLGFQHYSLFPRQLPSLLLSLALRQAECRELAAEAPGRYGGEREVSVSGEKRGRRASPHMHAKTTVSITGGRLLLLLRPADEQRPALPMRRT